MVLLLGHGMAFAALPTTAPPTRGAPAGNFITLLQNYAFDIAVFGGLAIAVVVFFIVCKNVIQTYSLVPEGRSTMGQVGMQSGVGVLLLVFIIFLLTQAAVIL
jgi:integrating conjugative element membrane protein (TIGR03745 family)